MFGHSSGSKENEGGKMGAPAAAIIIRRKENQLVNHFRAAGALSPDTAMSLADLQVDADDFALGRLHRRAVIRAVHSGEYYLDEEVWRAVRNTRRRLAAVIVALIVIGLIWLYLTNGARGAPLT
jgi:hypothetical protein